MPPPVPSANQDQFRDMVAGVRDYAIFLMTPDGIVATWNNGAERIKGYRADEIVGRHFSVFYPPEAIEKGWPEAELTVAARDGRFEDEGWRIRKDGSRFWANVVITACRDDAGRVSGFLKITRDLTDRKRAEERLKDYAERLQLSNRELEQFASVAAHDLQEPLRKIQAFGDRLRARAGAVLDEQSSDYLARMLAAAARMRTLIEDILAFSRVGRKGGGFVPVDLTGVVREVIGDLDVRLQEAAGRVELGPLPTVEADPVQMRQLFQNLIGNSLKFRRPDEPLVVTVTGLARDGLARITVRDNGIGFEPEYRERIFEVFQRLHGHDAYEGTGIGLAICRKIVERHGGTITAEGVPRSGATFLVAIPTQHRQHE
jgi:PAS domain S-box-containing protein